MEHAILRLSKKPLTIALLVGLSAALFARSKVDGVWEGTIEDGKLPMVFHIRTSGSSTVDSPKQNTAGLPATVSFSGHVVKISMPGAAAYFEGVLKGSQIVGTFMQAGKKYPMTLKKRKKH